MGRESLSPAEAAITIAQMPFLVPMALCGWAWIAWIIYWGWAGRRVQRAKWSEGIWARMQHILPLLAGFLLIFHTPRLVLVYGRWHHSPAIGYGGLGLTLAGLAFAIWARVHLGKYWSGTITLKEGHRLIRSGPYAIVRHPVYTGMILAAAGSALGSGTVDAAIGFVLVVLSLVFKSRREEMLLTREFGDEYLRFKREVPSIVPYIY